MRLYISGPMTGLPDNNFPAFNRAAAALRSQGYAVVNPAELNPEGSKTWHECMRVDIRELCTCQGLVLLPGWQRSQGAQLELQIAHRLALVIRTIDEVLPENPGLQDLVTRLRTVEHGGDIAAASWPPLKWRELTLLLDELERLQALNLGLLSTSGNLSTMLADSAATVKVLRSALEEAEAGLVFAGAVDTGKGRDEFTPSPVLALRAVRQALAATGA